MSMGGVTQSTFGSGVTNMGIKLNLSGLARELLDPQKLSQILEECMAFGEQRAKSAAPFKTGELKESIGHRTAGMKGNLYATEEHAAPVEYGHKTRGGTFVSARPFMDPALEDAFDLLQKRIQRYAESVAAKQATTR